MNSPLFLNHRPELSDDALRSAAPSVFAESPLPGVSERYSFVPTAHIVTKLRKTGWSPVVATEQTVRLNENRGFQKHLLRFQRRDLSPVKGEFAAELVLVNSHDRSSAYQLHAGLFRFVCSNGLVVSDAAFGRVSIRHSGFTPDEVTEASFKILEGVPAITARVEFFQQRTLNEAETSAFAEAALRLRYEDSTLAPVSPHKLLTTRRREDAGNDLWHIFNRLQENLLQGGQRDFDRVRPDGRRFARTRAITGLDQNLRINRQLWALAERLASGEPLTVTE